MDGISLVLVMLTTFLGPLVILSTWNAVTDRVREFMAFLLFLQTAMLGTFFARDMLLFYVFWEAMLIPMYFIIGIWGGQRRIYAAVKFFIFTMVGSVFMLVGILYLYFQAGSMDLADFLSRAPGRTRPSSGSSRPSSWPSPSRCRSFRCTPGCPTPTSRRRPPAR